MILGIIGVIVLWAIILFNGFVTLKNRSQEAWADIDVQLKRRYDLIPNLVNAVKGYMTHESQTFENITKARSEAMNAQGVKEKGESEDMLSGALKSLFAVTENYPDLKANQNFLELQTELSDTENKIQSARRFYNGNVRDLNIKIESFPSNLIANLFKFTKRDFFELAEESIEKENVEVKF
ncbi:LemA family protein [Patescibacteria group bacterium]|nr:LemA family protein [Patescibacteria group bacterium]